MNTDAAYQELERLGVTVEAMPLNFETALASPCGYLAIDYRKIETESEELEVLLHEIGHFETAGFYSANSPLINRQRAEYRATRFVFEKYYPPEQLAQLMYLGATETWSIAEELALPERFVREMLAFYKEFRAVNFYHLVQEIKELEPPPKKPEPFSVVMEYIDEIWRTRGIYICASPHVTIADIDETLKVMEESREASKGTE